MNPDDILCEHCNKYPVYQDDKCVICLEKEKPVKEALLRVQERILDHYANRITAELKAKSKLLNSNGPIDFEDLEDDMREALRDMAEELDILPSCN